MTYRTLRSLSYSLGALLLAGCSTAAPPAPRFVSVGGPLPTHWPAPAAAPAGALPKLLALHVSALDVPVGSEWSGEVSATTNTVSVELMTNLFSLRPVEYAPGRFRFRYRILDLPPFLVRGYRLRVFLYDAAGKRSEIDIPFRFSGRRSALDPAAMDC